VVKDVEDTRHSDLSWQKRINATSTDAIYRRWLIYIWVIRVIDNFSILLSHALLAVAIWILMNRADLDVEDLPAPDEEPTGFGRRTKRARPDKARLDDA
jgi:hypothetical protein